ncbi:MAG: sigma 54-interacting transcriptional regulator [Proteobacteria bacterium]|nr:sigma 54-interacting transcriptional regulator [Pseudomonadota bacterium]
MKNILLVSDNQELIQNLETIVTFMGESCQSRGFSDCERYLQDSGADAVLIEHISPAVVSGLVEKFPHIPFVALVENNSQASAGCNLVSVIATPLTYPVLTQAIHRCQEYSRRKPSLSRTSGTKTRLFRSLVGKSEQIQIVRRLVEQVAPTDATVLILGESGTGKEVVARNVHFLSERKDGPFIPVNCGAIPGELLESELFGHEKGAFTGAIKQTLGKVEVAGGGTLFLDEIGDMPPALQARMLRFLQERVIERVGGRKEIPVDVRVVCATNQDLQELIANGAFREDLYYRIAEVTIELPLLKDRSGDISALAYLMLEQFSVKRGRTHRRFSQDAIQAMEMYAWPGNVRELQNKIKAASVMAEGKLITAEDLALAVPDGGSDGLMMNLKAVRGEAEKDAVQKALAVARGNVARAAELLGITRPTLYDLINRHEVANGKSNDQAQGLIVKRKGEKL